MTFCFDTRAWSNKHENLAQGQKYVALIAFYHLFMNKIAVALSDFNGISKRLVLFHV